MVTDPEAMEISVRELVWPELRLLGFTWRDQGHLREGPGKPELSPALELLHMRPDETDLQKPLAIVDTYVPPHPPLSDLKFLKT